MNEEESKEQKSGTSTTFIKGALLFAGATTANTVARGGMFWAEYLSAVRSQTSKSYSQLWCETPLLKKSLSIFGKTSFVPNMFKSVSNMGVISLIDYYWPDLNNYPITRAAAVVAPISAVCEAITTGYGERNKVNLMMDDNKSVSVFNKDMSVSTDFKRIMRVSLARSYISGVITFASIGQANNTLNPYYPDWVSKSAAVAASTALGGCLAQIPMMPINNLHIAALRNVDTMSFSKAWHSFWDTPGKFKGLSLRMINRGGCWGIGYGVYEVMKEEVNKHYLKKEI